MSEKAARKYDSPLRQQQAARTRDAILDALRELLRIHHCDEITTKLLAARAGVAQQTIYRHFPDRAALVAALEERTRNPDDGPPSKLEEWVGRLEIGFQHAELGDDDRTRAAALLRVLGSTEMRLRMREEFGVDDSASGQLVRWAIAVLAREINAGQLPPLDERTGLASEPERASDAS